MALAVDAVHAGDEWIRHAPHRSDLLGRAATPTDGRWQRGEHVPGLYLAEDTALRRWRDRLALAFDGLGNRYPAYQVAEPEPAGGR